MEKQIHRQLHDSLFYSASEQPEKSAVIVDGKSYSYRQVLDDSLKVAGFLHLKGVNRGDRVVILFDNTYYCVIAIFGTLLIGGVFSVLNTQIKSEKLSYTLNDCKAKALITDILFSSVVIEALQKTPCVRILISNGEFIPSAIPQCTTFKVLLDTAPAEFTEKKTIPLDLAALIYTSGSTGIPKGVMMTHQAMVFTVASIIQYLRLSSEEYIINTLPLSFDYGLYQLLMTIRLGATIILERSFAYPARTIELINTHNVTVFPGVPTMYMTLLGMHGRKSICMRSVSCISNTAAALPAEIIPMLREIFPRARIYCMYGLTECKRVSYLEPELIEQKPHSVGKAIPGTELFILDQKGLPVQPGQIGKLYVRGPHIMAGYWNKPELSAEMLKPGKIPGELILCTQDLFVTDEDGFLYFKGRSDDIIKSGGQKVSPVEIENVLYSISGINNAAVIGVPDPLFGETIWAFICLEDGFCLSDKELRAFCSRRLEHYLVPREFVILDRMPMTTSGKISKRELRRYAEDHHVENSTGSKEI